MIEGLEYHCHGVGQNIYHLVWKPKYAMDPFKFPIVREHCEQFLREIAHKHNMKIFELQVEPDHIHLFVGLLPTLSVSKALQLLKGGSAYKLFRQHPWLRRHFQIYFENISLRRKLYIFARDISGARGSFSAVLAM